MVLLLVRYLHLFGSLYVYRNCLHSNPGSCSYLLGSVLEFVWASVSPPVKWKLQWRLPHRMLSTLMELFHVQYLEQGLAHSECSINVLILLPKSRLWAGAALGQNGTLLGEKDREGGKGHWRKTAGGAEIEMPSWSCGISCRQVHRQVEMETQRQAPAQWGTALSGC